ncbi:MAG: glycosyltransferase family 39 protein [Nanoarchaeota archaeon]
MIKGAKQKVGLLSFFLFLVLFLNYLVYPVWLVFNGFKARIICFFLFTVIILISVLLFKKWNGKTAKSFQEGKPSGDLKVWFVLFIILFLSQAILLAKPLTYPGDEDYHIGRAAYLYKPIEKVMGAALGPLSPVVGYVLFFIMILGFIFAKCRWKSVVVFVQAHLWKIVMGGILLSFLFFWGVNHLLDKIVALQHPGSSYVPNLWILIRYTPLPAYLFLASLFFFGYQLFFIRLGLLVLVSFTAFFLFKTIHLLTGRRDAAWFGSLAYFFLPSVFYYSSIAFIDPALDLFMMASVYFFLRYLKNRRSMYASYLMLLMVTGFFFKDFIIILYGLFLVFLGLDYLFHSKLSNGVWKWLCGFFVEHKGFLLNFIIFLLAVLPWILTAKMEGVYYYDLHVLDVFSMFTVKMFSYLIPAFTGIFFFLFVAGLVYYAIKGRQAHRFVILWFVGFFCFHAMHIIWNKDIHRYSLHYTLPALILGVLFLYKWVSNKGFVKVLPWLLLMILAGSTLFAAYRNAEDRYVPFDDAYQMLSGRMQKQDKVILVGMRSVTYMAKYDLNWDNILFFEFSSESKPVENQSVDRLYNFSLKQNMTYILTSDDHPAYGLLLFEKEPYIWGDEAPYLKEEFIRQLVHVKDPRFCLLEVASQGINQVYLFRVTRPNESLKGCKENKSL